MELRNFIQLDVKPGYWIPAHHQQLGVLPDKRVLGFEGLSIAVRTPDAANPLRLQLYDYLCGIPRNPSNLAMESHSLACVDARSPCV